MRIGLLAHLEPEGSITCLRRTSSVSADIPLTHGPRGPILPTDRDKNPAEAGLFLGGRYWARTSDPQLVELVLSQLS
jgi:hypothetical protein